MARGPLYSAGDRIAAERGPHEDSRSAPLLRTRLGARASRRCLRGRGPPGHHRRPGRDGEDAPRRGASPAGHAAADVGPALAGARDLVGPLRDRPRARSATGDLEDAHAAPGDRRARRRAAPDPRQRRGRARRGGGARRSAGGRGPPARDQPRGAGHRRGGGAGARASPGRAGRRDAPRSNRGGPRRRGAGRRRAPPAPSDCPRPRRDPAGAGVGRFPPRRHVGRGVLVEAPPAARPLGLRAAGPRSAPPHAARGARRFPRAPEHLGAAGARVPLRLRRRLRDRGGRSRAGRPDGRSRGRLGGRRPPPEVVADPAAHRRRRSLRHVRDDPFVRL